MLRASREASHWIWLNAQSGVLLCRLWTRTYSDLISMKMNSGHERMDEKVNDEQNHSSFSNVRNEFEAPLKKVKLKTWCSFVGACLVQLHVHMCGIASPHQRKINTWTEPRMASFAQMQLNAGNNSDGRQRKSEVLKRYRTAHVSVRWINCVFILQITIWKPPGPKPHQTFFRSYRCARIRLELSINTIG